MHYECPGDPQEATWLNRTVVVRVKHMEDGR